MPPIKYYEVEQTRTVKVSARNESEAGVIATEFLTNGESAVLAALKTTLQGAPLGNVEVTDLTIRKERY